MRAAPIGRDAGFRLSWRARVMGIGVKNALGLREVGIRSECLGADKDYGSGEFLVWLLETAGAIPRSASVLTCSEHRLKPAMS